MYTLNVVIDYNITYCSHQSINVGLKVTTSCGSAPHTDMYIVITMRVAKSINQSSNPQKLRRAPLGLIISPFTMTYVKNKSETS